MALFSASTLFDLPLEVSCRVLSSWLDVKSASRLDAACCSKVSRHGIMQLWISGHMVFPKQRSKSIPPKRSEAFVKWACTRQARSVYVSLRGESKSILVHEKYLAATKDTVTHLHLEGIADELWAHYLTCSYHSANLKILHLSNCILNEAFEVLLRQCPRLSELFFVSCTGLEKLTFDSVALPHLHTLGFEYCDGNNVMDRVVHSNHAIKNLCCIGTSDYEGRTVAAITRQLNLQKLSLYQSYLKEAQMLQIANACTQLREVDLANRRDLTDETVHAFLSNNKHLSTLVLQGCERLTDVTLQSIAQHCTALRCLDICYCANFTNNGKQAMFQACTQLQTLHVNIATASIVPSIPKTVSKLVVYTDATEAFLIAVGEHCKTLTELTLQAMNDRNLDKGIAALACGCPKLVKFSSYSSVPSAMLQMWQTWRPALQVSNKPSEQMRIVYPGMTEC